MPIASVVMPCYNAEPFLEQSILAVLNQSVSDFELLVVDDCSTDKSAELLRILAARDPRIRLIFHSRNLGASRSRNDGLKLAQGEYVGFCDADDVWKPDKLKTQIALLAKYPTFDVTYCDSEIIDESGQTTGKLFSDDFPLPMDASGKLFEQLCLTNFINMQTVLVRRAALGEKIYFDESIKWVEDWWQWIRLSVEHNFLYDSRLMAQYRVHRNSTGFTQKSGIHRNRWKVFRRNLRDHKNIPTKLQALLWYKMAIELSLLNRPNSSRKFMRHAIYLCVKGRSSFRALSVMLLRAR